MKYKVILRETDKDANKYFEYIVDGADEEAIANLVGHAELERYAEF